MKINFNVKIKLLKKCLYDITTLIEELQKKFKFVHNDLKCDNIFHKNKKFYLGDFDNSRIEINNCVITNSEETVKTKDFQYAPKPFSIDMCEEPTLLFLLRSLGGELNSFWDIGASSFGYMSINLASMNSFKGLIYSFEPNPKSFAQLETLVQALDKSAQVSVHNLALSSKSGIGISQHGHLSPSLQNIFDESSTILALP
jgi:hypothetical protein